MENEEELERIIDVFRPGQERARIELDRIEQTPFYKKTQNLLDSFVYDTRHGVLGWWDASTNSWLEIWGIRQLKLGSMERWTYFPKDFKGNPASLPSEIDLEKQPPELLTPLQAPYHVLKQLAMLTEQRSFDAQGG